VPARPSCAGVAPLLFYFAGEKADGPGFFGAGVAATALGGTLLALMGDLGHGVSYPVLGIGLIALVAGAGAVTAAPGGAALLGRF
jgi:hypothetical protein